MNFGVPYYFVVLESFWFEKVNLSLYSWEHISIKVVKGPLTAALYRSRY